VALYRFEKGRSVNTTTIVRRVALASVLAGTLAAASRAQQQESNYTELATRYRSSHGLDGLPTDETAVQGALDKGFASLGVGLFDVHYPWSALSDPKRVDEFKQLVLGLVDLQVHWVAWLADKDPPPNGPQPTPDFDVVRKWVNSWKPEAIRKAIGAEGSPKDFAKLAGATKPVLDAIQSSSDSIRTGSVVGLELKGKPVELVLAAGRAEFVGFTAFVGSLQDEWKKMLWTGILPQRNEFHLNELVCLALENAAANGGDVGTTMNDREKTGLLEHVTQYAADRLVKHYCGSALDAGIATGAAIDLVIELYGENNARVFGAGEGRSTPARFKFVRGGRSEGGKLAKISADCRWRQEKGKDYFTKPLRLSQPEGEKLAITDKSEAPGPTAHFELDCKEEPGEHDYVTAPFLLNNAATKDVSQPFFADYQEFLRAYRSAFVRFLMTDAKPKDADVKRPWAKLLKSCVADPKKPFEERAAAIFGTPLTAGDPSSKALEWQFLEWLGHTH
jgi:hypothetical protein